MKKQRRCVNGEVKHENVVSTQLLTLGAKILGKEKSLKTYPSCKNATLCITFLFQESHQNPLPLALNEISIFFFISVHAYNFFLVFN